MGKSMRTAVPRNAPGGLDSERSDHFDHCGIFTLTEFLKQKSIAAVTSIQNGGHEAGDGMASVQILQEAGAEAILVGASGQQAPCPA